MLQCCSVAVVVAECARAIHFPLCGCVQPWTGNFATRNYVQYQVYRASDGVNRANSANPNMCLVVAYGTTYSALALGLGSVNQYCRVSHYGFQNDDSGAGWTNTLWTGYSQASPRNADEAVNMVMRFPTLDAGASVTFTWAYVLNQADLLPALNSIATITIVNPTNTASGKTCIFSANVYGAASLVQFYVNYGTTSSLVGSLTTATSPNPSTGGGLYQITFDTTVFSSAAGYSVRAVVMMCRAIALMPRIPAVPQFVIKATIGSNVISSSKVINIDNTGPLVTLSLSPVLSAPFIIDNVATFTVSSTYVSGPAISLVYYYLDLESSSRLLGTSSTGPGYSVSFSATTLALYTLVTIRAVTQSATGAQQVITKTGIVSMPNMAPTAIAIAAISTCSGGPCIPETAPAGTIIGTLSATDPNPTDTFTYAIVGTQPFSIVGSSLVVRAGATFDFTVKNSYAFQIRVTDQGGLSFTGTYTVYLSRVNLPPTAIALSANVLSEASAVNFKLGTFSVTSRDSTSFTMTLTNSGSGSFYTSGMGLYVAKALSWANAPTVTITAQATDSNGLTLAVNFAITVTWVNKAPTAINCATPTVTVRKRLCIAVTVVVTPRIVFLLLFAVARRSCKRQELSCVR